MQNAERHGVALEGRVEDIARLGDLGATFDMAWLSVNMYSCVPTRKGRIAMARRVASVLKPSARLVAHYYLARDEGGSRIPSALRKLVAFSTFGNFAYQRGDRLWRHQEFQHAFSSLQDVVAELKEAGFSPAGTPPDSGPNGVAVFKKDAPKGY
jgi:hypothetical protein